MTAIAGLWRFDGGPEAPEACDRMLSAQTMYGPNGTTQWSEDPISIGRNIYRVLPEDVFDTGPIIGRDGRFAMVADVRLDNREELLAALEIPPHRSTVMCDAAVLLAAFEQWDESCLDRIVGDFAFALWDRIKHRLVLSRDFLGFRPLFYHRAGDFFAFSSMVTGLHALAEIPYAPNEDRVGGFLIGLPEQASETFFKDIERVEAGHILTVTPSGTSARRYWNPQPNTLRLRDTNAYVEAMRGHLDTATRSRLRRVDAPIGTHLSSGFDSSSVAATAARLLAPDKIFAFTSVPREGYSGPAPKGRFGDEGPLAAATAAPFPNMEHVLVRPNNRTPLDQLDGNFYRYKQPVLNLCNQVWMSAIDKAAKDRGITVMLTGQMGNMSISFDPRLALAELLVRGRWLLWFTETRALVRNRYMRWPGVWTNSFGPWIPSGLWRGIRRHFNRIAPHIEEYTALSPEWLKSFDLESRAEGLAFDPTFRPPKNSFLARVRAFRRVDAGAYFKGSLGGAGIDIRDPTADRRLVEFCLSLPVEQNLSNGVPRALAISAFSDRLPQEVLWSRQKGFQAIDWHEGATAALPQIAEEIERLALHESAARILDIPRLRKLIADWPTDGWERNDIAMSYRSALLRGISAGHFLRKASGGNM